MSYVTLQEAASYLGVSKATLRNWDKAGKLRAQRHPVNDYRVYAISDLQAIQSQLPFAELEVATVKPTMDVRATRSFITRLHNALRDHDSHSNIIERFDELIKLLFLKLWSEDASKDSEVLAQRPAESKQKYAARLRTEYAEAATEHSEIIPSTFNSLKANDAAICECAASLAQVSRNKPCSPTWKAFGRGLSPRAGSI